MMTSPAVISASTAAAAAAADSYGDYKDGMGMHLTAVC